MAATTLTRTYNTLLSMTLDAFRQRLADNIHKSIPLLWYLEANGKRGNGYRTENGGALIRIPVVWRKNATAGSYSGFDTFDVTPQDEVTTAFEQWCESGATVAIDRKSLRQNSGQHQLLNLMEEKVRIAEDSLREEVNRQLVAGTISGNVFVQGNGGKDMIPLAMIAGFNGTCGGSNASATPGNSLHGINPEVETWWKNRFLARSGTGYAVMRKDMQKVYNDCLKGGKNDGVDLVLADQASWEVYERSMFANQRYGPFGADGTVSQAFENIKYRNAMMLWDEYVPDIYTPSYTPSSTNAGTMFFLNTNWLQWVVDAESHFVSSPFREPHNQTAIYSKIVLMANMTIENRRKVGVYYNVNSAATAE